ncbi:MAG: transposase [Syntrophobacterales bacterium]|nr:transposase [Syntrophobacterales bacterium]
MLWIFHRKSKLVPFRRKQGHTILFLSSYSPELNLIERFRGWLKSRLRSNLASIRFI